MKVASGGENHSMVEVSSRMVRDGQDSTLLYFIMAILRRVLSPTVASQSTTFDERIVRTVLLLLVRLTPFPTSTELVLADQHMPRSKRRSTTPHTRAYTLIHPPHFLQSPCPDSSYHSSSNCYLFHSTPGVLVFSYSTQSQLLFNQCHLVALNSS